jgi:hypothetical protein
MRYSLAFLMALLLALIVGGPTLVRKFLRDFFSGHDVYVFLTINGREVCYKNPNREFVHEDVPLLMIPYEILRSPDYETYFNLCWFDAGALFRCVHAYHRTPENAMYCERISIENCLIGKILEQR